MTFKRWQWVLLVLAMGGVPRSGAGQPSPLPVPPQPPAAQPPAAQPPVAPQPATPTAPVAPASPTAPVAVTGNAVDASVVRVFSIGVVGTLDVVAHNQSIRVADLNAGHGTGFFVEGGLVVTAKHVVEDARHVVVRLPGDKGFAAARVVFAHKEQDIAVLSLDAGAAIQPPLLFSEAAPSVRSTVFTIGYPVDATRMQPQSARGIIAGQVDAKLLQLDMSLNPGNSGGPVVDEQDRVVGMAVARGNLDEGVQGIGFAVPNAELKAAVAEAAVRAQGNGGASSTSRESAGVVDEMVQHGALGELRKAEDLTNAGAPSLASVDNALTSLIARVSDADLLAFVGGALWNASLLVQYSGSTKFTPQQVAELSNKLRDASVDACRRAQQKDPEVSKRSPFVAFAIGQPVGTTGANYNATWNDAASMRGASSIYAAFNARFNPSSGKVWPGLGLGLDYRVLRKPTFDLYIGAALAAVRGSVDSVDVDHAFFAAKIGISIPVKPVHIKFGVAPGLYGVGSGFTSDSGVTTAFHAGLEYRVGQLQVGTGLWAFWGPTFWVEPITFGLVY